MLLTVLLDRLSDWNIRVQSFAFGIILILSLTAALRLKRRLVGPITYWDAVLPMVFLSPAQWQHFAGIVNLSHSAVPLLLLMLYLYGWVIERAMLRYVVVLALNFLMIFTGFGMFIGAITPLLLAFVLYRNVCRRQVSRCIIDCAALLIALLSGVLFFVNFTVQTSIDDLIFPVSNPGIYILFPARMLGRFVGYYDSKVDTFAFGFFLIAGMVLVAIVGITRLVRTRDTLDRLGLILFALGVFGLLYPFNVGIARAQGGLGMAEASRYVTLMIPGFFGLYLGACLLARPTVRRVALAVLCLLAASGSIMVSPWDDVGMWQIATLKRHFVSEFEDAKGPIDPNDPRLLKIHPRPQTSEVAAKLEYLRRHRLSFFRDASSAQID